MRLAVMNDFGEVLTKSKDFRIGHGQIDIKSPKSIELCHNQSPVGYIYIDESPREIKKASKIFKSIAELIILQEKYTEILSHDEKKTDQIIYEFLFSKKINQEDLIKTLKAFNVDLEKNRTALLVEISSPEYLKLFKKEVIEGEREEIITKTKRALELTINSFFRNHRQNLIFYLGNKNFLILKDMGEDPLKYQEEFKKTLNNLHFNLQSELNTEVTIGVGNFKNGLDGLRESFKESRTALQFGKKIWGRNKIFHYDNFGVVAPLFRGANKENIEFSIDIINRLKSQEGLVKTIEAYFENNLSISKTAKELSIHRNTLLYRLERIEEATDLDPKIFEDSFQLYMALILERYHG